MLFILCLNHLPINHQVCSEHHGRSRLLGFFMTNQPNDGEPPNSTSGGATAYCSTSARIVTLTAPASISRPSCCCFTATARPDSAIRIRNSSHTRWAAPSGRCVMESYRWKRGGCGRSDIPEGTLATSGTGTGCRPRNGSPGRKSHFHPGRKSHFHPGRKSHFHPGRKPYFHPGRKTTLPVHITGNLTGKRTRKRTHTAGCV